MSSPDGPDGPADEHPAVVAAQRLADDLLAPRAQQVDDEGVPRSHLDAIAAAGLLGVGAGTAVGGLGAPPSVVRRVTEVLAGADLATWFVQVQHHGVLRAVEAAGLEPQARDLATGRVVAGTAFSHIRRHPARPVVAEQDGDGWRLTGRAPWYTGWGLNDVAHVGGVTDDDRVVFGLLPARDGDGVTAGPLMRTAALTAARTVTLDLDRARLGPDDVVLVQPRADWARVDARAPVNVNPAVFGVASSALDLLEALGERRGEPAAGKAAAAVRSRLTQVRAQAYALMDDVDPDERVPDRLALRARAHEVMVEATTALVVAGAGASMAMSDPAQRKAREALFLLVQAQTAPARTAALERYAEADGADG